MAEVATIETCFAVGAKGFLKEDARRNNNNEKICEFMGARIEGFSKEDLIRLVYFLEREREDASENHLQAMRTMSSMNRLRRQ